MRKEIVEEREDNSILDMFITKPKKAFSNGINIIKFIWSASILLATLAFSLIGILFKILSSGFTIPVIILMVAASMYLVVLLLYYILLRARLKGKDDWAIKETVYNTKYLIKVIKVIVPIMLLFNLIGKPLYDIIVASFSVISIIFGLVSFIIATAKLTKRIKSRKERKEKHNKKKSRK